MRCVVRPCSCSWFPCGVPLCVSSTGSGCELLRICHLVFRCYSLCHPALSGGCLTVEWCFSGTGDVSPRTSVVPRYPRYVFLFVGLQSRTCCVVLSERPQHVRRITEQRYTAAPKRQTRAAGLSHKETAQPLSLEPPHPRRHYYWGQDIHSNMGLLLKRT